MDQRVIRSTEYRETAADFKWQIPMPLGFISGIWPQTDRYRNQPFPFNIICSIIFYILFYLHNV